MLSKSTVFMKENVSDVCLIGEPYEMNFNGNTLLHYFTVAFFCLSLHN